MKIRIIIIAFKLCLLLSFLPILGCFGGGGGGGDDDETSSLGTRVPNSTTFGCFIEDYSDAATSEYILPYQVGMTFRVSQGNCGRYTHKIICTAGGLSCGDLRYAYDFFIQIGLVILAARGGTVVAVEDQFSNSTTQSLEENFVIIEHVDGTIGRYLHLSPNSLMVNLGDTVSQGDPIALAGDSGFTGSIPNFANPHLHFDVIEEDSNTCTTKQSTIDANGGVLDISGCKTFPVTFRNAQPLDTPLLETKFYTALPF